MARVRPASFSEANRRLARQFANELQRNKTKVRNRLGYTLTLSQTARTLKLKGKVHSGCFRAAFVGRNMVFKIQYEGAQARLREEATYIKKMRKGPHARHFPLTELVRSDDGKTLVLIQERVPMTKKSVELRYAAAKLGNRLGIDDVHDANYGWSGPKGREYPVFIDVDFRRVGRRGKVEAPRSWMVL